MDGHIRKISLIFLLLIFIFINNFHSAYAEDIRCPICDSTDITLFSTTATCIYPGEAVYICNNTSHENHVELSEQGIDSRFFPVNSEALGHKFIEVIDEEPTCLKEGIAHLECERCEESEESYVLKKTGHSYIPVKNEAATCLEDGISIIKCTVCSYVYEKKLDALGHDFIEKETVETSCTEDGYILRVCKRCDMEEKEIFPSSGHILTAIKEEKPTCTSDGYKEGICENCKEKVTETLPALGHDYGEEWIIEKEATVFKEGKRYRECKVCKDKLYEALPKKSAGPLFLILSFVLLIVSGGFYYLKKSGRSLKDVIRKIKRELLKPSFADKTIITLMNKDDLYRFIKIQKHLKVIEADEEDLLSLTEENGPDLILIDASDKDLNELKETLLSLKDEYENPDVSLMLSDDQLKNEKDLLEELKNKELIRNYAYFNNDERINFVKLVLPSLKPDLKSDEALENIGMVADYLDIPGVSAIIDIFISGREIKETIDEKDEETGLSFVDKSVIISDIASILGLDTIADVAGLIGDLDDIKSSLESKIGGNEASTIKDAVEDIVEVVSDNLDL